MFDIETFAQELQERIRAKFDEATLPTIGTADNVDEALLSDAPLPAVYVIYSRGTAKTQAHGGRQLVIGHRRKIKKFDVALAIVTESYASKTNGRLGGWRLLSALPDAVDGWKATGMLKTLQYLDEQLVIRTLDGTRVLHQQRYDGEAEILTTPLAP